MSDSPIPEQPVEQPASGARKYGKRPEFTARDMYWNHKHEVWTPLNTEVMRLLEDLKREAGSWTMFCEIVGIRPRYMRFIRHGAYNKYRRGRQKTISLMLMDRILVAFDMTHRLYDFKWYTTTQLVEQGIWLEHADVEYIASLYRAEQARRRADLASDVVNPDNVKSVDEDGS